MRSDYQCSILPPGTARHRLGVHPAAWIPGVEFYGVLLDVALNRRPGLHYFLGLQARGVAHLQGASVDAPRFCRVLLLPFIR